MNQKKDTDFSCACVCIAKDEAPYIHEFIHHYLYFGFKHVLVLVNRTSDATVNILNRISSRHSNVTCTSIDWIDMLGYGNKLQALGYAYGIAMLRKLNAFHYAFLPDVDEFWYPINFVSSVEEVLSRMPTFASLSCLWAKQESTELPFEPPFKNQQCQYSRLTKSFVDLTCPILNARAHACSVPAGHAHIAGDGRPFLSKPQNKYLYKGRIHGHPSYVLHRMQRSEPEYLATLERGNTFGNSIFKHNRTGYEDIKGMSMLIPCDRLDSYHESLDRFAANCGILSLVEIARASRMQRAEALRAILLRELTSPRQNSAQGIDVLRRIFRNTRYQTLLE